MKLRQLACFVAVVDEGSFTRAAQTLGVAQPSLSQQVRSLEQELGGPLVERLPRGVSVTPAGRALLPAAWNRRAQLAGALEQGGEEAPAPHARRFAERGRVPGRHEQEGRQ